MTIALDGTTLGRPTPVFKVQFNGEQLPGYAQSLDEPFVQRIGRMDVPGRDGGSITRRGLQIKEVTLSFRLLTRLNNVSGIEHLNDLLTQYREALRILNSAEDKAPLYIGDTDRYLMAVFESASMPLTADNSKAATFNVSFATDPLYIGDPAGLVTRTHLGGFRTTGTAPAGGTLPGLGSNFGPYPDADGNEMATFNSTTAALQWPTPGTINMEEGSFFFWYKPIFSNTSATTRPIVTFDNTVGVDRAVQLRWNGGPKRFELVVINGAGTVQHTFADVTRTFPSGELLLLGFSWEGDRVDLMLGRKGFADIQTDFEVLSTTDPLLWDEAGVSAFMKIGAHAGVSASAHVSDVRVYGTRQDPSAMNSLILANSEHLDWHPQFNLAITDTAWLSIDLNTTLLANGISDMVRYTSGPAAVQYPEVTLSTVGSSNVNILLRLWTGTKHVDISYTGPLNPPVVFDYAKNSIRTTTGVNRVPYLGDSTLDFSEPVGPNISELLQVLGAPSTADGAITATLRFYPRYER